MSSRNRDKVTRLQYGLRLCNDILTGLRAEQGESTDAAYDNIVVAARFVTLARNDAERALEAIELADRTEGMNAANSPAEKLRTDSQWLKSLGFVEGANKKDYILNGWFVVRCENGKWSAYSVRSSHWHLLRGVDLREDVLRLVDAIAETK